MALLARLKVVGRSLLLVIVVLARAAEAASVVDLEAPSPLDPLNAQGYGINESGLIVGVGRVIGGQNQYQAVAWSPGPGGYTGTILSSSWSYANAVNDLGTIVGRTIQLPSVLPTVWSPDGSGGYDEAALPTVNGSGVAYGINSTGVIAGADGGLAAIWTPDGAGGYDEQLLPVPVGVTGSMTGWAINASGQVSGWGVSPGYDLPILWTPDGVGGYTAEILPIVGFNNPNAKRAWGLNDAGAVVGHDGADVVVWTPDGLGGYEVVRPGSPYGAWALGISNSGHLVGQAQSTSGGRPAVWTPDGAGGYVLTFLPGTGGVAYQINEGGAIAGYRDTSTYWYAAAWSLTGNAVPEPSTVGLALFVVGALVYRRGTSAR